LAVTFLAIQAHLRYLIRLAWEQYGLAQVRNSNLSSE